jgi:hypothetical protein
MKGGIGNLMKQAQQMQDELQKAQARLAEEEVSAEAGGGMVKVTMTGRHEVRRIEIDDSLLSDDKEMLEDLVAAAVNAAVQQIATRQADQLSGLTAGLSLPPGMKLPF